MLVGHLIVGIHAQALPALDVRVDRAALDRPRPDDRHLDGDVLQVLRPGPVQRLHLGPALDLEDARRLRLLDALVGGRIVVGDPAQVDLLAARALDQLDRALHRGEHPQPQQVDLQEAGVRAGILVPLHDLAALHRRRHDRAAVDQRPGGHDHPARVLAEVARQPVRLRGQPRQPRPAPRGAAAAPVAGRRRPVQPERRCDVLAHLPRIPALAAARHPLDLSRRQPQRLAQLADRPPRAIGRKRRHQRRAVVPVALVHPRDQLLADVTREVEVDVGQRGQLVVQEAPDQQVVGDRIDVREAGQEADDRGDARAPPAPRRQQPPHAVGPTHLDRHLAGQLQHVVMEQEEPGQPEPLDDPKLLLEPGLRLPARGDFASARVAGDTRIVLQPRLAQLGQLAHRLGVLRSRIAIAEVAAQVEPQPLGQPRRLRHRLRVLREAAGHRRRRGQHVAEVAAPLGLRGIERGVQPHRDQRVLERRARAGVRVHVAGCHARHPEALGDPLEPPVARPIIAQERPLELDPQAIWSERVEQAPERELVVSRPAARTRSGIPAPRHARARRPAGRTPEKAAPASHACAHAHGSGSGTGSTSPRASSTSRVR